MLPDNKGTHRLVHFLSGLHCLVLFTPMASKEVKACHLCKDVSGTYMTHAHVHICTHTYTAYFKICISFILE